MTLKSSQQGVGIANISSVVSSAVEEIAGISNTLDVSIQKLRNSIPSILNSIPPEQQGIVSGVQAQIEEINKISNNIKTNLSQITSPIGEINNLLVQLNNANAAQRQQAAQMASNNGQVTAKGVFNLKKYSQEISLDPTQDSTVPQVETIKFKNQLDLLNYLNSRDLVSAINDLLPFVKTELEEDFKSQLQVFYEIGDPNDKERINISNYIFNDYLKDEVKVLSEVDTEEGEVVGISEQIDSNGNPIKGASMEIDIKKDIKESEEQIKKLAMSDSKKPKVFNLKTAQHATVREQVLWGPDSKRISPFLGMLESDWHVVERNKGWGFRVGDLWNIDFETIWRSYIMDKYSSAYRNEKGEWVGGYIQKRFEVDKWIPEGNNLQLKPGELRKPRPQSSGTYEARMQAYRGNKEESVEKTDFVKSASFNLKNFNQKKK